MTLDMLDLVVKDTGDLLAKCEVRDKMFEIIGDKPEENTMGYKVYLYACAMTSHIARYVVNNKTMLLTCDDKRVREIAQNILELPEDQIQHSISITD